MMTEIVRQLEALEQRVRDLERQEAAQAGSFVPTLVGATIAGTFTYDTTNTVCNYTRVGDLVILRGRVRITAITVSPTGDLTIRTLPFTAATTGFSTNGGAVLVSWTGLDIPAGFTQVEAQVLDGETQLILIRSGDAQTSARVQGSEATVAPGSIDLRFVGFYQV